MAFNLEDFFDEPLLNDLRTDKIDIFRLVNIGTELDSEEAFVEYKNVSANLEFKNIDNPDVANFDRRPVLKTISIHCSNDIDLKNNDKIIAYKLNSKGEEMAEYTGVIGEPSYTQSGVEAMLIIDGGQKHGN